MVMVMTVAAVGSSGGWQVRALLRFFLPGGRLLLVVAEGVCCPLVVVVVVAPLLHLCPHLALCSQQTHWPVVCYSASTVDIGWSRALW